MSTIIFIADNFLLLMAIFTVLCAAGMSYFTHRKATDREAWKRDFRQTLGTIGGAGVVLFLIMLFLRFFTLFGTHQ